MFTLSSNILHSLVFCDKPRLKGKELKMKARWLTLLVSVAEFRTGCNWAVFGRRTGAHMLQRNVKQWLRRELSMQGCSCLLYSDVITARLLTRPHHPYPRL